MKCPKYKARFIKARRKSDGTVDKYNSGWTIYADKQEVHSFTLRSIGCEQLDVNEVYTKMNSVKFGKALIKIVKAGLIPNFRPRVLPIS
jgi:hypothetical protein